MQPIAFFCRPGKPEDARSTARFLLDLSPTFSRIICAPLDQSQETAALIAEYFGITQLEVDDRLLPPNRSMGEFGNRQNDFAFYLLDEAQKIGGDILIVCPISNIMYWWREVLGKGGEITDIVFPGGVLMVTEHTAIPVFKPNLKYIGIDTDHEINEAAIKGEPGTGYESGAKGPFSCGNCEYFRNGSCGQKDMMEKSQRPKTKDGRVLVDVDGCCEFVDRPYEEKK